MGAAVFLVAGAVRAHADSPSKDVEFFESRIRPVLAQDCYECHRSHGKKKGGLALDSRQSLLEGGDSGKVLVPGDPDASLLIKAIRHTSEDLQMPKARAGLERRVISDFEAWIRMGAPDPRDTPPTDAQISADTDWAAVMKRRKNWWSFQPLVKPAIPEVSSFADGYHPVDRFLDAKMKEARLLPSPKASRGILIRRLSFALRGLPPSPGEIETFERDDRPDAYLRLVDYFLASPRFGERWARHWMDWLRYADSHGSEGDPMIPNAWRYRDYLIRALNDDVPYNQLVREHLAGDLLPNPRINHQLGLNESALGIGHLRMVFHGFAPTDALDEQVRFTDDQINVVSKAFLGLTLSCARCHNHKFDPVSQKDFYGWFGVFASCPPAAIAVDAPEEGRLRESLARRKNEVKRALGASWLQTAGRWVGRLTTPDKDLAKSMDKASDPSAILHPFYRLLHPGDKPGAGTGPLAAWRQKTAETAASTNRGFAKRWNLRSAEGFSGWRHDGPGVSRPVPAGGFAVAPEGDLIVAGIYPSGVYSHLDSSKDRGVLLSPRFSLDEKYDLWLRVAGDSGAVARYVVRNYPRDGSVFPVTRLNGGEWRWVKLGLDYWQGDVIHVEVTTAADQPVLADLNATRSWFGLSDVMVTKAGEPGPVESSSFLEPLLSAFDPVDPADQAGLAVGYANAFQAAAQAWLDGKLTDGQALLLDKALQAGLLPNRLGEIPELGPLMADYRRQEAAIRVPTRAQGVIETDPVDQPLFVRGDHKQPGEPVPRHFLDAIDASPYPKTGSGRLQLAADLLRADNPLTSRVIVNRIWHHLFGRGIVATPDNFGRMGREPSHPELLDYLAVWFVEHGYSIKDLIRFIVTSDAWQRSSDSPPGAGEKDPNNILLTHFNVRRLEAEAIRDAMLDVSGDLQPNAMYGPPVFGREPRRSVYRRVKRNEMDPFLSVFDAPVPSSPAGKRDVTNVPCQSLTLLNDPLVLELAGHWAARLAGDPALGARSRRIQTMFTQSLGRPPSDGELARAEEFLHWSAGRRLKEKEERGRLDGLIKSDSDRLAALISTATARALAKRAAAPPARETIAPAPVAAWDFKEGARNRAGGGEATLHGNAKIENGALVLDGNASYLASTPLSRRIKAKTLEAWVQLAGLDQQGGGVISIQDLSGTVFDAIVFGEKQARRWMAGSDGFARTREFGGVDENEAGDKPVRVAITYAEDGTVTGYRNGRLYGKPYQSGGPVVFEAGTAQVLLGNRHGEPGGNKNLAGRIRQARLYDRALSAEEIAGLAGEPSDGVTPEEMRDQMTAREREDYERLRVELAAEGDRLKSLDQTRGLSSEWADLAHGMMNLKEFIFIR